MSLHRNAKIAVIKRSPKWGTVVNIWAELSDSFALYPSLDDPDMTTLTHIRTGRHVHTSSEESCRALMDLLQSEPIDWDFEQVPPEKKAALELRVMQLKLRIGGEIERRNAA